MAKGESHLAQEKGKADTNGAGDTQPAVQMVTPTQGVWDVVKEVG